MKSVSYFAKFNVIFFLACVSVAQAKTPIKPTPGTQTVQVLPLVDSVNAAEAELVNEVGSVGKYPSLKELRAFAIKSQESTNGSLVLMRFVLARETRWELFSRDIARIIIRASLFSKIAETRKDLNEEEIRLKRMAESSLFILNSISLTEAAKPLPKKLSSAEKEGLIILREALKNSFSVLLSGLAPEEVVERFTTFDFNFRLARHNFLDIDVAQAAVIAAKSSANQ